MINMDPFLHNLVFVLSISAAIAGSTWSLSWWLSRQFSSLRDLIYSKISQTEKIILDKLEYHEKHDDQRFNDLHNQIWEIKILNAAQSGIVIPTQKKQQKQD